MTLVACVSGFVVLKILGLESATGFSSHEDLAVAFFFGALCISSLVALGRLFKARTRA